MSRSVSEVQQANTEHFLGHGPGLSYAYQAYVIARRTATGEILLGGLGGRGVGQMWFTESEDHQGYPGYADAEIVA